MKRYIKTIARTHRALGKVSLPILGVWFLSGFGMLFFRYPALDHSVWLTRAPQIVNTLLPSVGRECIPQRVVGARDGTARVLCQGTSQSPEFMSSEQAIEVAAAFLDVAPNTAASVTVLAEPDLWTLPQRFSFPLARVDFETPQGDTLYVSHRSSEVVHWTTRIERIKAWLGPIPHWLYVPALRRLRETWRYLVILLALLGTVAAVSGLIAGTRRVRRTSTGGWSSVFKKRQYRWHHVSGLVGGSLIVTWTFSGALSLNPLNWSSGPKPTTDEAAVWSGAAAFDQNDLQSAIDACVEGTVEPLKELTPASVGGYAFGVCGHTSGISSIVELRPPYARHRRVPREWIEAASQQFGVVQTLEVISEDAYHYPRHGEGPLAKVYRVTTDRLTLYADETTGNLVMRLDLSSKAERWLYHGLHSVDIELLYRRPLIWRAVVIGLLLLGVAVVATAVSILVSRWRPRSRIKADGTTAQRSKIASLREEYARRLWFRRKNTRP